MHNEPQPPSGFCAHLRSKKLFFVQGQAQRAEDYLDASNHCWCFLTMQVVGPEGKLVHPRNCQAMRVCFQPPDEAEHLA